MNAREKSILGMTAALCLAAGAANLYAQDPASQNPGQTNAVSPTTNTQSQGPSQGKVTLNSDFTGTVIITAPNGELTLIEPGDPIPAIANGSTLEVFDGKFGVQTSEGAKVSVSCLDHEAVAKNGAAVSLSCGEKTGLLKVLQGSVELTDPNGKTATMSQNAEFTIQEAKEAAKTAAPTGGGEAIGGSPAGGELGDAPPVDSRNIDESPSR